MVGQIEEEGFLIVLLDESNAFAGKGIGQILAFGVYIGILIKSEIAGLFELVESLAGGRFGAVAPAPEIPHAVHGGGVSAGFESFGNCEGFCRKGGITISGDDFVVGETRFVAGVHNSEDAMPWGVLARHKTSAGWRAIGRAGVGLAENDALPSKCVRVWRIDKIATGESHVFPSHIINQDDNEVGFGSSRNRREKK